MPFTPDQLRKTIADWEKRTGKKSPMKIVKPEDSSLLDGEKQAVITESPKQADSNPPEQGPKP